MNLRSAVLAAVVWSVVTSAPAEPPAAPKNLSREQKQTAARERLQKAVENSKLFKRLQEKRANKRAAQDEEEVGGEHEIEDHDLFPLGVKPRFAESIGEVDNGEEEDIVGLGDERDDGEAGNYYYGEDILNGEDPDAPIERSSGPETFSHTHDWVMMVARAAKTADEGGHNFENPPTAAELEEIGRTILARANEIAGDLTVNKDALDPELPASDPVYRAWLQTD